MKKCFSIKKEKKYSSVVMDNDQHHLLECYQIRLNTFCWFSAYFKNIWGGGKYPGNYLKSQQIKQEFSIS